MENLERMQQMFSDLNRYAQRSSKSLNILYDQRDNLAALTMHMVERVDAFRGMVDMERVSIPLRSDKLFTLTTIYDANKELFGRIDAPAGSPEFDSLVPKGRDFWDCLANVVVDWKLVAEGKRQASAVRQEKISTHAVVMRALGGVGRLAFENCPDNWREQLERLREVDWRKSVGSKVNPMWDGVCITAGSVVSNRQARFATFEALADKADLLKYTRAGTKGEKRKRGRPKKKAA
jgi:DNA sulfur modification protein DndB